MADNKTNGYEGTAQKKDGRCGARLVGGFSLIDLLVSLGIITVLFGGIYLVFFSILDAVTNIELRGAATAALNRHLEVIRNLPYGSVGTVGGVPQGIIPQTQTSTVGDVVFSIATTIRNIDDPFDGTLGGTPNDTAPSDYKLIELQASCLTCPSFVPLKLTATVAPKDLESASAQGSLFTNVFDANAVGVGTAAVRVINAGVAPAIDITDTTNVSGSLQLVGLPSSTQGYRITVSKSGYSSEQTYSSADLGGATPVKPHATISPAQVTQVSFSIDRTSTLTVDTSDQLCALSGSKSFSISGAKLIGTNPDVLKFTTSSATNASGTAAFSGIEWDTYSFGFGGTEDVLGTIPLTPMTVNPNAAATFRFVLQAAAPNSLLITVKDAATGGTVVGATTTLWNGGFSKALVTGRSSVAHTDWSGGNYASQDGGIEVANPVGKIKLLAVGGSYPTSTEHWLISNTIDFGGSATFYSAQWDPASQPGQTGPDSLKFQLASNNDNATWNFLGPDGTASTYYTASGAQVNAAHNGSRYLRYRAHLTTQDELTTPQLNEITFEFTGPCVPPSQTLFTSIGAGDYTVDVDASGYQMATSAVTVSGAWQQVTIPISPQ